MTEDFWKRSQERAETCKLLVTNHAYFVTRLEDNPEFVSDRLLIIDEVQKILLASRKSASRDLRYTIYYRFN